MSKTIASYRGPNKNLVGKRFNKLVVEGIVFRRTRWYWRMRCVCGKQLLLTAHQVSGKKVAACSRRCRFGDMVGRRFGRLVVERQTKSPAGVVSHGRYWLCRCTCGRSIIKPTRNLRIGVSCGCTTRLPNAGASVNSLFSQYRASARRRQLNFTITVVHAAKLFAMSCHYCGRPPSQKYRVSNSSVLVYNGIDRKNPKLGYEPKNVVSCCKICNQRKRTTPYAEFLQWIASVWSLHGPT